MPKIYRYCCPYCQKKYKRSTPLKQPKTVECRQCGEQFRIEVHADTDGRKIVTKVLKSDSKAQPIERQNTLTSARNEARPQSNNGPLVFALGGLAFVLTIAMIALGWMLKETNDRMHASLQSIQEQIAESQKSIPPKVTAKESSPKPTIPKEPVVTNRVPPKIQPSPEMAPLPKTNAPATSIGTISTRNSTAKSNHLTKPDRSNNEPDAPALPLVAKERVVDNPPKQVSNEPAIVPAEPKITISKNTSSIATTGKDSEPDASLQQNSVDDPPDEVVSTTPLHGRPQSPDTNPAKEARYKFVEGTQYRYSMKLDISVANSPYTISGSNFVTKLPKGKAPVETGRNGEMIFPKRNPGKQFLECSTYCSINPHPSAAGYSPYSSVFIVQGRHGKMEVIDDQPEFAKNKVQREFVPLLFLPYESIGIEPLPKNQQAWTVQKNVVAVIPKQENVSSRRYPDYYNQFPLRFRRLLYRPNPTSQNKETSIANLELLTEYKILKETENELRVQKTYTVSTRHKNEADVLHTVNAKGFYVFDKTKRCIKESSLSGKAILESDNVAVTIPFEYSVQLTSTKTKVQLEEERLAAKKRSEESRMRYQEKLKERKEKLEVENSKKREGANKVLAQFNDIGHRVESMVFSPKNLLYVGTSNDGILCLDYKKTKKISERLEIDPLRQIRQLAVTPDGKKLLVGGYSGRIEIFQLGNNGAIGDSNYYAGHSGPLTAIAISPDSKTVISTDQLQRVRVWDLKKRRELCVFDGFQNSNITIFIAKNNSYALVSDGTSIMKIDLRRQELEYHAKLPEHSFANSTEFSPDGKYLATMSGRDVDFYFTKTFQKKSSLSSKLSYGATLKFSSNGKYLFVGDRSIRQWEWQAGRKVNEYQLEDYGSAKCIALTKDDEVLATTTGSKGIVVYAVNSKPKR